MQVFAQQDVPVLEPPEARVTQDALVQEQPKPTIEVPQVLLVQV
jgi:hypothetical protein